MIRAGYGGYWLGAPYALFEELPMPAARDSRYLPRLICQENEDETVKQCQFGNGNFPPFIHDHPIFVFVKPPASDDYVLKEIKGSVKFSDLDIAVALVSEDMGPPVECKPLNAAGRVYYKWQKNGCDAFLTGSPANNFYANLSFEHARLSKLLWDDAMARLRKRHEQLKAEEEGQPVRERAGAEGESVEEKQADAESMNDGIQPDEPTSATEELPPPAADIPESVDLPTD